MKEKIVPDTSILISGILTDLIEKKEIKEAEIIIPEFVVEELRAQASKGREIGFKGLEEIKKLRKHEDSIVLTRMGRKQTMEEIQLAKYGRVDSLIMDVAKSENAILYTSDMVQALAAEADGVRTKYFKPYERKKETRLSKFFTPDTMSVHLKEDCSPLAKRGMPGNFKLVNLGAPITAEEMEKTIKEIMDAARYEADSFIEAGGHAATVVQAGDVRIAIARPPFSDGIEITAVRPIAKLALSDYSLTEKLKERITKKAEGIIIAGPPGSGKSTFAAALAEYFDSTSKIVKTMESPRDLQVKKEITQYSKLRNSFENTADLLLLVRPDYTIFDEVRKTEEFEVFSDMRLAGIGMVGVVHATDPIDAVQRFIGRVELGIIPHIIDTIIYIKEGKIHEVFNLVLVVRTPTGMQEADLARPIVEVRSFETNELKYEIYTYGEENVTIPISSLDEPKESGIKKLAKKQILAEIRKFDKKADVEIIGENNIRIKVENDAIPLLIGKKGKTIKEIEESLGVRIDVAPKVSTLGKEVNFEVEEKGAYLTFSLHKMSGKFANFYIDDEYLFSATVGKNDQVRVAKDSEIGEKVMQAVVKDNLKCFILSSPQKPF